MLDSAIDCLESKSIKKVEKMKKSGFTLIELIFVIVIIGVLAAVAIPKYNELRLNAQVSNIIKPYSTILENGRSLYLNEKELNDKNDTAIDIVDFIDTKGKGWTKNTDDATYKIDDNNYVTFTYNNNGTMDLKLHATGKIQTKLATKLNVTFSSDENTTTLKLNE